MTVNSVQRHALVDIGFTLPSSAQRPWIVLRATVGDGAGSPEYIWLRTADIQGLNPMAVGDDVTDAGAQPNRLVLRGGDDDLYVSRSSDGHLLLAYGKNVASSDIHVRVGVIGA